MPIPRKSPVASLKNPSAKLDKGPVWKGPEDDSIDGGISFSLLSRFLVCRERFYLLTVKGLKAKEGFNHLLEYGNMWHVCEECLSGTDPFNPLTVKPHSAEWEPALATYCDKLRNLYPQDRQKIDHWHSLCTAQFPMYVGFWRDHPETKQRLPLEQERVFHVKYKLPSGREVWLKGKRDALDLIQTGVSVSRSPRQLKETEWGVYIQENKTKSDIDQIKIKRQLTYDLQTMMYMLALIEQPSCDLWREGYYRHIDGKEYPIKGVRYNVIKRSAHKSPESMLKKIDEDIANNRGEEWFAKWTTDITLKDVRRFCQECLDPILENLCDWWAFKNDLGLPLRNSNGSIYQTPFHWRHPYGVYNPMDEGRATDLDEYLATGSMVGLEKVTTLFPELKEVA